VALGGLGGLGKDVAVVELLSNSAHLHVLFNHVPTVGFGMGLGLFLFALIKRNDVLKRTCLVIFFVVANVAIATYTTGNGAESVLTARNVSVAVTQGSDTIKSPTNGFVSSDRGRTLKIGDGSYRVTEYVDDSAIKVDGAYPGASDNIEGRFEARPGISAAAIRSHEDAALLAFVFMEITGFFAWLALWEWRRVGQLPGWHFGLVLLLSTLTFALMARAAERGGEINHQEVRTAAGMRLAAGPVEGAGTGIARDVGLFVNGSSGQTWVWATCETLHFVGLSMLFSVVLLVDLRMLGWMKSVSFAALYQLLPIGMVGFGINLITGMLFFIAVPGQYVHNVTFFWKIVFVLLGGFNVLYFILDDVPWTVREGIDAPFTAKLAAASAIFIWVIVLFCGHMLPFIGNAF